MSASYEEMRRTPKRVILQDLEYIRLTNQANQHQQQVLADQKAADAAKKANKGNIKG